MFKTALFKKNQSQSHPTQTLTLGTLKNLPPSTSTAPNSEDSSNQLPPQFFPAPQDHSHLQLQRFRTPTEIFSSNSLQPQATAFLSFSLSNPRPQLPEDRLSLQLTDMFISGVAGTSGKHKGSIQGNEIGCTIMPNTASSQRAIAIQSQLKEYIESYQDPELSKYCSFTLPVDAHYLPPQLQTPNISVSLFTCSPILTNAIRETGYTEIHDLTTQKRKAIKDFKIILKEATLLDKEKKHLTEDFYREMSNVLKLSQDIIKDFLNYLQITIKYCISHGDLHQKNGKIWYKEDKGTIIPKIRVFDWDKATFGHHYDPSSDINYALLGGGLLKSIQQLVASDEDFLRRMIIPGCLSMIVGEEKARESFKKGGSFTQAGQLYEIVSKHAETLKEMNQQRYINIQFDENGKIKLTPFEKEFRYKCSRIFQSLSDEICNYYERSSHEELLLTLDMN